jgi:hypothetical protein
MEEAMIIMVDRDMSTMAVIMDLGMGTMGATMVDIMVGTIGVDIMVDIMVGTIGVDIMVDIMDITMGDTITGIGDS